MGMGLDLIGETTTKMDISDKLQISLWLSSIQTNSWNSQNDTVHKALGLSEERYIGANPIITEQTAGKLDEFS